MYGTITIKLIVGMLGVIFFLRISGKAQMAQITPLDTVSAFVIGALIGGVIYNPDIDITYMIFSLAVWTGFNLLIRYLMKYKIIRKIIKGDAIYIVKDGILNISAFKRNMLEMEQFRTLLRSKDIFSMFDISDVKFETNGEITVSKRGETKESYLLINNGTVLQNSLINSSKTEEWLSRELGKLNFNTIEDLFIVEWTPNKGFYIVTKSGKIQKDYVELQSDGEKLETETFS